MVSTKLDQVKNLFSHSSTIKPEHRDIACIYQPKARPHQQASSDTLGQGYLCDQSTNPYQLFSRQRWHIPSNDFFSVYFLQGVSLISDISRNSDGNWLLRRCLASSAHL